MILKTVSFLHLLLTNVNGLSTTSRIGSLSWTASRPTTRVYGIRCEDKYYQLEEREDAECFATELFLKADRVIEFGETDGPLAKEQDGTWEVAPGTDTFAMTIRRKFAAGNEGSDMGEFDFEVIREYIGEMKMVGDAVSITGTMVNKDEVLGDEGT